MPPLFNNNQQLDESQVVDSLANKTPRLHKAMMISQGFNNKTGDLKTFVEHFKRAEKIDNIAITKFSVSDEDSNNMKH